MGNRTDVKYIDIVEAVADYNPPESNCLTLKKGDILYIQEKDETGWWKAIKGSGNEQGWIPSTYIAPIKNNDNPEELTGLEASSPEFPQNNSATNVKTANESLAKQMISPGSSNADSPAANPEISEIVSPNSTTKLPPNWRSRQTPTGQTYYYNPVTSKTTYNLQKVFDSAKLLEAPKRRSSLMLLKDNTVGVVKQRGAQGPVNTTLPTANPASKRISSNLLNNKRKSDVSTSSGILTWEVLINDILTSISDLNYSAKNGIKAQFLNQAGLIIRAIRDMLSCSNTISPSSLPLRANPQLATHHSNILASLSRLLLTAQVASGLWPPPDSIHAMRYQAGQVLLSVRHFVAVAQDVGVELVSTDATQLQTQLEGEDGVLVLMGRPQGEQVILRLETDCEGIADGVADVVTQITRDRCWSAGLVEGVRGVVVRIGEFLSLVDEVAEDSGVVTEDSGVTGALKEAKEELFNSVNELLLAASVSPSSEYGGGGGNGANGNNGTALGVMLECATSVLERVEVLLVATKVVIDERGVNELNRGQNTHKGTGGEEELAGLMKRAMGLNVNTGQGLGSARTSVAGSSGAASRFSEELKVDAGYNSNNNRKSSISAGGGGGMNIHPQRQSNTEMQLQSGARRNSQTRHSHRSSQGRNSQGPGSGDTNKLSQFFGEAAAPINSSRLSDQNGRPWFLRKDPGYEISYNMEGAVNGGTFPSLVERLTVHDQPIDPAFVSAFLLTFHLFGTSATFFQVLKNRFTMQPPPGLSNDEFALWTEKKLYPIQSRVAQCIKLWLDSYWIENEDDAVLDDIHVFASGVMMGPQPQIAIQVLELAAQKASSDVILETTTPRVQRKSHTGKHVTDMAQPILPKNLRKFTLLDLDPLEVARQLTMIEMSLFMRIKPVELMKQEWSRRKLLSLAINVRAMTSMSTKITGWVIYTILQENDVRRRAFTLKFFIKVGERCLSLNNFNSLIAIQSAFNSSTISRLKKTWELLSNKSRTIFEVLKKATDHSRNYADYRSALKRASLPTLPFLGLFLTDLTFTDDGNPDYRSNGRLINFDKYAKTARIIADLMRYQHPYPIISVPELADFLLLAIEDRGARDIQELYELSLRLEPRDERGSSAGSSGLENVNRELEAKIEMLQKAGML